jgi:hypothetical protein
MSYVNADGLEILTSGEAGTAAKKGTVLSGHKKALVLNLTGTELPSAAATPQDHDAFIPANSYITSATVIISTAFTSGGSATLTVGAYQQDGTTIDADGVDATIALSALNASTKAVACDGALVGAALSVGDNDCYIEAYYGTAAFTAGEAKLVIEYIEP